MDLFAPRILIVRLSAIGDVVHGLPALAALRERFPRAYIAWVVESRGADLLEGHKSLDELIVLERGWYKSFRRLRELRRHLRSRRFDVAIDLQGLTKSAGVSWFSGAPRRIGYGDHDGRELSRWFNNELVSPHSTHVIDRGLELLAPLGVKDPAVRVDLPVCPASARTATEILTAQPLDGPFAVINPGAGWRSKLWPPNRFAAVARYLGRTRRMSSLVVWADEEERTWAQEIVVGSDGYAALAPRTTLRELVALAQRAALFISSDTGPLHIAAAVHTPCVGLFGPMPAERNGPYGRQHIAIQKMRLVGTSRERRRAGNESMQAIEVAHVTDACDEILSRALRTRQSA